MMITWLVLQKFACSLLFATWLKKLACYATLRRSRERPQIRIAVCTRSEVPKIWSVPDCWRRYVAWTTSFSIVYVAPANPLYMLLLFLVDLEPPVCVVQHLAVL